MLSYETHLKCNDEYSTSAFIRHQKSGSKHLKMENNKPLCTKTSETTYKMVLCRRYTLLQLSDTAQAQWRERERERAFVFSGQGRGGKFRIGSASARNDLGDSLRWRESKVKIAPIADSNRAATPAVHFRKAFRRAKEAKSIN